MELHIHLHQIGFEKSKDVLRPANRLASAAKCMCDVAPERARVVAVKLENERMVVCGRGHQRRDAVVRKMKASFGSFSLQLQVYLQVLSVRTLPRLQTVSACVLSRPVLVGSAGIAAVERAPNSLDLALDSVLQRQEAFV